MWKLVESANSGVFPDFGVGYFLFGLGVWPVQAAGIDQWRDTQCAVHLEVKYPLGDGDEIVNTASTVVAYDCGSTTTAQSIEMLAFRCRQGRCGS